VTGLEKRNRVWRVLCREFFDPLIGPGKDVLDMACGYGEFINNVAARSRIAVDLNADALSCLRTDVRFFVCSATDMAPIANETVDIVFTSNFLEHLATKTECNEVFSEVLRVLRPGGKFIVLGPNIKYAYREYWDYFDHYLPLSHLSLAEVLRSCGFRETRNIARFLPFTMKSRLPAGRLAITAYLRLPLVWKVFGKQFLVVAEKPI
jgi:ubiquinone/menaquinone biosynthesis C-methylase UbiE